MKVFRNLADYNAMERQLLYRRNLWLAQPVKVYDKTENLN